MRLPPELGAAMDNIFGLSMNVLLVVTLVLLGISLGTVGFIALRNRIMFLMGVRNIPRRVAQTVLIIFGLMLSTLIISAAFTTGDTVDHSLTNQVYKVMGHVDEVVQFASREDAPPSVALPMSVFEALEEEVGDDPNIDGLAPLLLENVAVVDLDRRQSAPRARFVGLDEERMSAFPDLEDEEGNLLDVAALADDDAAAPNKLSVPTRSNSRRFGANWLVMSEWVRRDDGDC